MVCRICLGYNNINWFRMHMNQYIWTSRMSSHRKSSRARSNKRQNIKCYVNITLLTLSYNQSPGRATYNQFHACICRC